MPDAALLLAFYRNVSAEGVTGRKKLQGWDRAGSRVKGRGPLQRSCQARPCRGRDASEGRGEGVSECHDDGAAVVLRADKQHTQHTQRNARTRRGKSGNI